jgi:hypothetical protein
MKIEMQSGQFINIQLPNGEEVQVEVVVGQVMITYGPRVLLAMNQDAGTWEVTTPAPLEPPKPGTEIAPALTKGEASMIVNHAASRIGNAVWWAEKNGWDSEHVDENGFRIYRRKYDTDEPATLELMIDPKGRKRVSFGPIQE